MKATSLLLIIIIFLIGVKIFKVVNINTWIIVIGAVLWFIAFYWQTKQVNRKERRPKPVYITEPQ